MRPNWIVWVAVTNHSAWATVMLVFGHDLHSAVIQALVGVLPLNGIVAASILYGASACTVLGTVLAKRNPTLAVGFLMPQQVVLWMSALAVMVSLFVIPDLAGLGLTSEAEMELIELVQSTRPTQVENIVMPVGMAIFHNLAILDFALHNFWAGLHRRIERTLWSFGLR